MNRHIVIHLLALLLLTACKRSQTAAPSALDTTAPPPLSLEGSDIKLSPEHGSIRGYGRIYVSFPTDMVAPEQIKEIDEEESEEAGYARVSPIVITPNPGFGFRWITPRRGVIQVDEHIPEVAYRVTLQDNLVDVSGKPVNPKGWGAEMSAEDFGIMNVLMFNAKNIDLGGLNPAMNLPAMPRARLEFNHDVLPTEVADRVAYIDAESGERHAVTACLEEWQTGKPQGLIFVQPRKPLQIGRHYWLVVDRLPDASGTYETSYLRVYPAGFCAPVAANYARGYNQPRHGRFARVFFNQTLSQKDFNPSLFSVTPAVPGFAVKAEGMTAVLSGDFKEDQSYTIQVAAGALAISDFATSKATEWKIRIPERRPSVIMPTDFIAQRFSTGLDVTLHHSRTQELTWRIAQVPPAKLNDIRKRLREFAHFAAAEDGKVQIDPRDQTVKYTPTDSLIDSHQLPFESGNLPAAPGDEEIARRIQWKPGTAGQVAGLFLLEVQGTGLDGRICGNRMLVSLSDWHMNFIATEDSRAVRLSHMDTGAPVSGLAVQALADDNTLLDEASTDEQGIAHFTKLRKLSKEEGKQLPRQKSPSTLMAGNALGRCFQEGDYSLHNERPGRSDETDKKITGMLVTNGDLYEPGEEIQLYALVRSVSTTGPSIPPPGNPVTIQIDVGSDDDSDFSKNLEVELDEAGAGTAKWTIPADLRPSRVYFSLLHEEEKLQQVSVDVTKFRPPTFAVELTADTTTGTRAEAHLSSSYFHGSANRDATVTWTAEWVMQDWLTQALPDFDFDDDEDDDRDTDKLSLRNLTPADDSLEVNDRFDRPWRKFSFSDRFSPAASKQGLEGVLNAMKLYSSPRFARDLAAPASHPVRGQIVLDKTGTAVLVAECPFPNRAQSHRAQVFWTVDVKTEAGQSRRAVAQQHVQFPTRALAIRETHRSSKDHGLPVEITTINAEDEETREPAEADVEIIHRTINTVADRLSEKVLRYRNAPEFRSVTKKRLKLPFHGSLPADVPGDYVISATPVDMPDAIPVSVVLTGVRARTDLAVVDDASLEAVLERDDVPIGGKAIFKVRTPFPGTLRVTVEAGTLLETLPLIQMTGTETQVEVPVRKEYFPNVFIRFQLMSVARPGQPPAERFAVAALNVNNPELQLKVMPVLDAPTFHPRQQVSGHVLVKAGAQPVRNAKVLVFAVDDAILSLTNWALPNPASTFYPERNHSVRTNFALGRQWSAAQAEELSQFEKGYILGASREKTMLPIIVLRENAHPRPLWQTLVNTDEQGRAAFSFPAPDSLTSYRITAVAHTTASQFGSGEVSVHVSNPLLVEPFIPQFIREDDELIVRAQLTQDAAPELPVEFTLAVEGSATLLDAAPQMLTLKQGSPKLVAAKLKAGAAAQGSKVRVIFKARATSASALADGAVITLDLLPKYSQRTEIVTGNLETGAPWKVTSSTKPAWSQQPGSVVDVLLSGTRWLPQLVTLTPGTGKNTMLTDMAASALTPYLVPALMAYLPWQPDPPGSTQVRTADDEAPAPAPLWLMQQTREGARRTISLLEGSLIPDEDSGWLPRFPNGKEVSDPTTALVSLAVQLAQVGEYGQEPEAEEEGDEAVPSSATSIWSERLITKLENWRENTLSLGDRAPDMPVATPFVTALALLTEALEGNGDYGYRLHGLKVAARFLFEHREKDLGLEGRCFLAMAVWFLMEADKESDSERPEPPVLSKAEWQQLLAEISGYQVPAGLDPVTLSTPVRANAIRLFALSQIATTDIPVANALSSAQAAETFAANNRPATAQENVWQLLVAQSYLEAEAPASLTGLPLSAPAHASSANGVTLGWLATPAQEIATRFTQPLSVNVPASWLLRATYRAALPQPVTSPALSLTRQIYSHKNQGRDGSAKAPLQLGDYVLLTYQITSDQPRSFVVIEDELPAALEFVNAELPAVRELFKLPKPEKETQLDYTGEDAHGVRLTIEKLPAGLSTCTVLTQVVGSGTFSWPAALITPLYDQRLTATTADVQVSATH
ncbi:MAG: hypothetical protein NTY98_04530 [Verrucomicrobia bacterium]|nr:hypothetical protein [Verrucomicrobiota bacterium]